MKKSVRNKVLLATGAGVAATGAIAASAASLGTITPQSLGTTANVVAACQSSGLGVTWSNGPGTYAGAGTATSTSGSTFTQDSLTISGVDANCNGKNMKVVLANSAGTAVATSNVVTAATGTTVVSNTDWASGSPFDTKSVSQVTVTIYG